VPDFGEPSPTLVKKVRIICLALPEAYEEPAWVGTRWRIRKLTIAHIFNIDFGQGPVPAVMFRSTGPEGDPSRRGASIRHRMERRCHGVPQ
jgi:hypothetical protein